MEGSSDKNLGLQDQHLTHTGTLNDLRRESPFERLNHFPPCRR